MTKRWFTTLASASRILGRRWLTKAVENRIALVAWFNSAPSFLSQSQAPITIKRRRTGVLPPFLRLFDAGNVPYRVPLFTSVLLRLYPSSNGLLRAFSGISPSTLSAPSYSPSRFVFLPPRLRRIPLILNSWYHPQLSVNPSDLTHHPASLSEVSPASSRSTTLRLRANSPNLGVMTSPNFRSWLASCGSYFCVASWVWKCRIDLLYVVRHEVIDPFDFTSLLLLVVEFSTTFYHWGRGGI